MKNVRKESSQTISITKFPWKSEVLNSTFWPDITLIHLSNKYTVHRANVSSDLLLYSEAPDSISNQ